MEDSRAEFDSKDLQLLEQARLETDAFDKAMAEEESAIDEKEEAADQADDRTAPKPDAVAEEPAAAVTPVTNPAALAKAPASAESAAATADAAGSARAALRASRHKERQLNDRISALEKRLSAQGGPAADAAQAEPDESQLEDVRSYAPDVGKRYDALQAENAELRRQATTNAEMTPKAFEPQVFEPDIQDAIDEVPDLLLWQSTPEFAAQMDAVKHVDAVLSMTPKWAGKPLVERFAAATAEVKAKFATPSKASAPKTLEDARRVIATKVANGRSAELNVGDLRGGTSPASDSTRDPHAMVRAGATDEDVMASLPVLP